MSKTFTCSMQKKKESFAKKSEGVEALKDKVVSDGTLKPEDLIPKFLNALKHDETAYSKFLKDNPEILEIQSWDDVDDETKSMLVDELTDALNDIAPDGYFFGASDGDGACFGFWAVDPDESKKSEAAEDALVSKATDYIMRNAKRANVSISITPIDNTKDYVGFEIDGVTVHGLPAYISVYFNRDDGSVNNLAFFNNDPTLNKGSDVDIMVDAPIFEKDPARVFNEFLRQADSANESKKSEGVGGKIKMGIDYNMFMRMCASAAYLDENEDYWDALWEYYSEMGEIEDACEFFDNLFQYTSWCDEDEVYDEYLDDSYKDGTKSKAECIEAAVDAGDLDVFKTDKGYLVIQ